jgi:peptidyl-prolyl cis-trans isomerase A (cyclophilin A)
MHAILQTNLGSIKVRLFQDKSPKTVANFTGLATGTKAFTDAQGKEAKGPFYDGTIFHRVIPQFMVQAGDPTGTGRGGPGYRFEDEFSDLRFDRPGLLAMANAGPNTNGSQFFITTVPTPHLNNKHTIFGEVVEGYDVVEAISATPRGSMDKPTKDVVLEKVTVTED